MQYFVHCAGFMKLLPLKMLSVKVLNRTFNVNVFSSNIIVKTLMQKKANSVSLKSVVFISSNISNMGASAFSTYAASKGALDSSMRCLAVELAPRVRINSILPGAIQTGMTKAIYENETIAQKLIDAHPLGIGQPEDIYGMVSFLLSENAKWITGQQITIDGGRTIDLSV